MKKKKDSQNNNIETDNSTLYHQFRSALATNDFKEGDSSFIADLSTDNKKLLAHAEIKPSVEMNDEAVAEWKNNMVKNLMAMDDLTADVLDILTSVWLEKSSDPGEMVRLSVNDFLRIRGITEKKSGSGRRGGFEEEQRKIISKHMDILDNTWIKVHEMEVTEIDDSGKRPKRKRVKFRGASKAVYISYKFGKVNDDDNLDAFLWDVRPGDVFANFLFGSGRQTALLSQKALEYDPYRQKVEKRLARYLAWQWRNRQSDNSYINPFTVKTLLNATKEEVNYRHPLRTKERLEKALELLQDDGVIRSWQYENFDESENKKGWVNDWLSCKILIEPPESIFKQYDKIRKLPIARNKKTENLEDTDLANIRIIRKTRNLSILQAAEQIGISPSRLSRIERGETPSDESMEKINQWMKKD